MCVLSIGKTALIRFGRLVSVLLLGALALFPNETRAQASIVISAGEALASGAVSKVGGESAGWVLSMLGLNPNPGSKEKKEFKKLDKDIKALDAKIEEIENSIITLYKAIIDEEAGTAVENIGIGVAKIEDAWTMYKAILEDQTASPSDISELNEEILNKVADGLNTIDIDLTSKNVVGSTHNSSTGSGLLEVYSKVISLDTIPSVGDKEYYKNLHDVIVYYNKWRYRAVTLLLEYYHYQALQNNTSATPATVCVKPIANAAKNDCRLAAHYAKRYFHSDLANPNAGLINQLRIVGASMTSDKAIPIVGVSISAGKEKAKPLLAWIGAGADLTVPSGIVGNATSNFEFSTDPATWKSAPAGLATVDGFGNWRFASTADGVTLLSAASEGKTLRDTLKGTFPWISNQEALPLTLGSDATYTSEWMNPFVPGSPNTCMQNYADITTVGQTTTACGTVVLYVECPPGYGVPYAATTFYGPFYNTCRPEFPYGQVTTFTWTGPEPSRVLAVTDAKSCPAGQSGENPAGWLKPCEPDWVMKRYASYFPSSGTFEQLTEASAPVQD